MARVELFRRVRRLVSRSRCMDTSHRPEAGEANRHVVRSIVSTGKRNASRHAAGRRCPRVQLHRIGTHSHVRCSWAAIRPPGHRKPGLDRSHDRRSERPSRSSHSAKTAMWCLPADFRTASHTVRVCPSYCEERGSGLPHPRVFVWLGGDEGELSVVVHGEANRFLTDARAVLSTSGQYGREPARSKLDDWNVQDRRDSCRPRLRTRNQSGGMGTRSEYGDIDIVAGKETTLAPAYLHRARESTGGTGRVSAHRYAGHMCVPGESFATRVILRGALGGISGTAPSCRSGRDLTSCCIHRGQRHASTMESQKE